MPSADTWISLPYKYILNNKLLPFVKLDIERSRARGEFHQQTEEPHGYKYPILIKLDGNIQDRYSFKILIIANKQV